MAEINTINGNDLRDSRINNLYEAVQELGVTLTEALGKLAPSESSSVSLLDMYPVGSIYISTVSTDPTILFGGTWEKLKDRFLLGDGDSYKGGNTGGEAAHVLTVEEMPAHTHEYLKAAASSIGRAEGGWGTFDYNSNTNSSTQGGDQPHNNMPPYLVVYMWERKA